MTAVFYTHFKRRLRVRLWAVLGLALGASDINAGVRMCCGRWPGRGQSPGPNLVYTWGLRQSVKGDGEGGCQRGRQVAAGLVADQASLAPVGCACHQVAHR